MKKKALLSSILTIALCLSVIAGSTYALFTSEKKFNIEVTAGKVDISADVENFTLWSVQPDTAGTVEDEKGNKYTYEQQTDKFANGGTAGFVAPELKLEKITPGDMVKFNITNTNNSNVAIQYRYVIECISGYSLMNGLVITVNDTAYKNLESYTSGWTGLDANASIDPISVSIELPVTAGNEYQDLETSIRIVVEAVQGNAATEGSTATVKYLATDATALQNALNAGGECVLRDDIVLKDTDTALVVPADKAVTLDLNGFAISQTKACTGNYAMLKNNGTLTVTDTSEAGTGKISFTDSGAGDSNFIWGSYTVSNNGTLVVENGTIENLSTQNKTAVSHMYCAIQQDRASASTTIHGGKISTPTYRSIRINRGTLTITGGECDGQVWVQPNDNGISVTISGGSFSPNGADGSSVFVTNADKSVALSVTGGSFETKIGCSDAAALAGCITGGEFTDAARANTDPRLFSRVNTDSRLFA